MPPEEINFQTFFAAKLKDRGVSIKKLSEATGIAPSHLESLERGRWDDLPSSPYVRGYLVRLGKVLDFDGEEWWDKIKKERLVQNSGPADSLPNNRFLRRSPARFIWVGVAAALVIIYLAFQIPAVFAGPQLIVAFPAQNPYTTSSSTITLAGTVHGADSLSLNNGGENSGEGAGANGDSENITIAPDGSWQKAVLLQNGPNTFQLVAKKLLGGSTQVIEQIFYQSAVVPAVATGTATSTITSTTPAISTASSTL